MIRVRVISVMVGLAALPVAGQAASLYFSPSSGSVTVGQSFSVAVKVNAGGQAINAADGTITFPASTLRLTSVSRSGSIFTLWPNEPSGSNSTGRVTFSGGLSSPGYSGSGGTILSMRFEALKTGSAGLAISGGSVLANDGQGTNVLTSRGQATFTVAAATAAPVQPSAPTRPTPVISSTTHADEEAWTTEDQATFTFTQPSGLLGVSFGLTSDPNSVPDESPDPTDGTIEVTIPRDGIWYFHLRGRYESGWSGTDHYAIRLDRTRPAEFTIQLERDRGEADPTPVVRFSTEDALSGIKRYRLIHNQVDLGEVSSPHTLTVTSSGRQELTVLAEDLAGNIRESRLEFSASGYPAPLISSVPGRLVLLDDLVVRGSALAGDTVAVLVDDQVVGRVTLPLTGESTDQALVRLPWTFTSQHIFGPGRHRVSAYAISADGQESSTSDPIDFTVIGSSLRLGDSTLLTFAAAPAALIVLLAILVANGAVLWRVIKSARALQQRDHLVDSELHALQHQLLKQKLNAREVEKALEKIEEDLERPLRRPRKPSRRSS